MSKAVLLALLAALSACDIPADAHRAKLQAECEAKGGAFVPTRLGANPEWACVKKL